MPPYERTYHRGELLGRGGFGKVYAGIRLQDSKAVAIKYVRKDKVVDWEFVS